MEFHSETHLVVKRDGKLCVKFGHKVEMKAEIQWYAQKR